MDTVMTTPSAMASFSQGGSGQRRGGHAVKPHLGGWMPSHRPKHDVSMTQPKGDMGIQARNSLSREASTVPDHPSLSFTEAFKASFAGAAHALPSGYRRVTWARNQEGEAWATIGPYKANFIIGLAEGVILLTDQRSERVLGRWSEVVPVLRTGG